MSKANRNDKLPAIALMGLGGIFLISQITGMSLIGTLWPLFVILPGLPFLYYAFNGGKNVAGLIFPGLFISGTGAILMYQNLFNHWESWAYAWALYPVFVGLGLIYLGRRTDDKGTYRVGRMMTRMSLMGFAGLALLFELVFFGGLSLPLGGLGGYLAPILLIIAGLVMWNRKGGNTHKVTTGKRKNNLEDFDVPKRKNGHHDSDAREIINPELQRQIDDALAEDSTGEVPIV